MLTGFSTTTLIVGGVLLAGTVSLTVWIWRSARPSGAIGQLLHRTEKAPYHGEIDPRRFSDRDRD